MLWVGYGTQHAKPPAGRAAAAQAKPPGEGPRYKPATGRASTKP
jgi:hypothetical protein